MQEFEPMGMFILIKKDEPKKETDFGIEIPESLSQSQKTGVVLKLPLEDATNRHLWKEDKSFCNVNVGDRIMFFERAGVKHEDLYLLRITEVIAKFN